MRSRSDERIEPSIALLAPVPLDLLEEAETWKPHGEVAFGSRAGLVLSELEAARAGHRVRVYLYASHNPAGPRPPRVTWTAEYVGLEEAGARGRHPEEASFRTPLAREDGVDYWLVYWHVMGLRRLETGEQIEIAKIHGRGKQSTFAKTFEPEGPVLIEPLTGQLELETLLERTRSAPPESRIEWRKPLAEYGLAAVDAVTPWLKDEALCYFAVTVIERVGTTGHKERALQALRESRPTVGSGLQAFMDAAIGRLGGKGPPRPEPVGPAPPPGTLLIVGLKPSTHHMVADYLATSPTRWGDLYLTSCGWVFSGEWVRGHGGPGPYAGQGVCGHCKNAVERGK